MSQFEAVIGLEVHIQLLTKSKAYAPDSTEFGSLPNTNVSVITLGHPGTLPRLNEKSVEYAVRLGIACNAEITEWNQFARKNYFYADLPKGYQITQDTTPICRGGYITIKTKEGEKMIELTRIHMEEDAGKSIHDLDPFDTLVDLNRAGVPLLEIVTEPVIRSGEEAYQYLTEIRKLVRYLDICDGNMEEGSMRCDANISVRPVGSDKFGSKVEVKNMNSIRNVQRAIEHEIKRQIECIGKGERIAQETRSFDAVNGTTFVLRTKEASNDYRYFPDPDLVPVIVSEDFIKGIREQMPPLPNALFKKYTTEYNLSEYDAQVLTDTKEIALYFEEVTRFAGNHKTAANWVMGPVKSYLNENALDMERFPISAERLAQLMQLVDENKVSYTAAAQKIFPVMAEKPALSPLQIAEAENLLQESDAGSLQLFVAQALEKYPEKVAEYKNGKVGLLGLFMGEVMKLSKGKADPKVASQLVKEALEK